MNSQFKADYRGSGQRWRTVHGKPPAAFPLQKLLHRYGLSVSFGGIAANAPPSAQRSDTDERIAV
jgi:hypothetical protein